MSWKEICVLSVAAVLGVIGLVLSHMSPDFFKERYVIEDGWIEWLTVVALVCAAALQLKRGFSLRNKRTPLFVAVTMASAALFLFGAGEEISWGQRLLNIETPDFFEKNRQNEMNLHNFEIGGVNINKLVFSKILGVVLLFYLIIIPLLCRRHEHVASFINRVGVPLPRTYHVIIWIVAIVLSEWAVGTSKRGELREFLLTFILLAQLIRPLNHWIYNPKKVIKNFVSA